MIVNCKKSYSFSLNECNEGKKQVLIDKALEIRDLKNYTSQWICDNFITFVTMNKFDMCKHIKNDNPLLSAQDYQHAIYDVYTKYDNKLQAFKKNTEFKIQDGNRINVEVYKRNSGTNLKGDIKSATIKKKKTALSITLQYLVKYYNPTTVEYMTTKIASGELEPKKEQFYKQILEHIDKFGNRLINLANDVRARLVQQMTEHPIEFNSLSFSSINMIKTPIVAFNKNKQSVCRVVITLGSMIPTGNGKKSYFKLEIPTKYSKKYHGKLKDYQKGSGTSYTIVFDGDNPVRLCLTADRHDEYSIGTKEILGVDVNVKHNLFALSNGSTLDYDRKDLLEYIKFLKKLDAKKERLTKLTGEKSPKLSKRDQRFKRQQDRAFKSKLKEKCSELVRTAIESGHDHIVIEDLGTFSKGFSRSDEFEGFKYSRLTRLLGLADIKNILHSICKKKGVQLSIINPAYTSQQCPKCGNITRDNRETQEDFVCTSCGFAKNADLVASINIFNRVSSNVLKAKLLKLNKFGWYEPKIMKYTMVKDILEESWVELDASNRAPVVNRNHDLGRFNLS